MITKRENTTRASWLTVLMVTAGLLGGQSVAFAHDPTGWTAVQGEGDATDSSVLFYISPMASLVVPSGGRETHIGYGGTFNFGLRFSKLLDLEASVLYNQLGNQSPVSGSTRVMGLGLNALAFPFSNNLYVEGGVAYERTHNAPGDSQKYSGVLINLGVGYVFGSYHLLGIPFFIRTEAQYRLDAHNAARSGDSIGNGRRDFSDGVFNVGLIFPIGGKAHPHPKPAAPQQPEIVPVTDSSAGQ